MDKRRKEALVIALFKKGKTYQEIAKEAGVPPIPSWHYSTIIFLYYRPLYVTIYMENGYDSLMKMK